MARTELEGKTAAVTGAASGIGLASTEALLAEGVRVVIPKPFLAQSLQEPGYGTTSKHLADPRNLVGMAARHVADGEMVIARQKELIEKLRSEGGNVSEALEILQAFLRSQQVFVAYHSALQRDLSEADPVLDVGIAAQ